jgi:hypothetical protein
MLKGELSTSPVLLVQNVVPDENQGVNGATKCTIVAWSMQQLSPSQADMLQQQTYKQPA